MKPFTFNPQPNLLAGLFAQWIPMYVGQARMDDDEAEPFQDPLCEIEKAIISQPITTMQDFFLHHAAGSCFGTISVDYPREVFDSLYAVALKETADLESLHAAISEHMRVYAELNELLAKHDGDDPAFDELGGNVLQNQENELLLAVARHPARSHEAIVLKGRYFAAREARGDLGFYHTAAFIASFDTVEGV